MPIEEQVKLLEQENQALQAEIVELRQILFKKTGGGASDVRTNDFVGKGSFKFTAKDDTDVIEMNKDDQLGFFDVTPIAQQANGADLTNNVTAGGTNDIIADYTDLSVYANDAATIRNNLYQLARKLKVVNDALRDYGLMS